MPRITGAEYFSGEMLYRFYLELKAALRQSYLDFSGDFAFTLPPFFDFRREILMAELLCFFSFFCGASD